MVSEARVHAALVFQTDRRILGQIFGEGAICWIGWMGLSRGHSGTINTCNGESKVIHRYYLWSIE